MASKPSGIRPPSAIKLPSTPSASTLPRPSGLPTMRRGLSSLSQADPENQPMTSNVSEAASGGPSPCADNFMIGDTVWVGGVKRGKIAYIGETQFAKGEWAGVVLDDPLGKNDGAVSGVRYFQCVPLHGAFTRLNRLSHKPMEMFGGTENDATMTPARLNENKFRSPSPTPSQCKSSSPGVGTPSRLGSPAPLKIGDRVIVQSAMGTKRGVLRYMGPTDFAAGDWGGIELDQAIGKNDGSVGGRRYFQCRERFGLFAPLSKVSSSPMNRRPSSSNLRRQSSRESLISNLSSVSSVAPGSSRRPSANIRSNCLPTCSLQIVLKENEKHTEQLLKERDLDRNELALITKQYDECLQELKTCKTEYLMLQQNCAKEAATNELDKGAVNALRLQLEEEYRKYEDLLFGLEEERIAKSDLQAQLDAFTDLNCHKNQFENEIIELKQQLANANVSLSEKTNNIEAKIYELNEANKNVENLKQEISKVIASMNETNQTTERMMKENSERSNEQQEVTEQRFKEFEISLASKEQVIKNLEMEHQKSKTMIQDLSIKLERSHNEIEKLREHKSRLEDEVMNLVTSSSSSSTELTEILRHKDDELAQLMGKLQLTEQEFESSKKMQEEKFDQHQQTWLKSETALKDETNKLNAVLRSNNTELEQIKKACEALMSSDAAKSNEIMVLKQSSAADKENMGKEYSSHLKEVKDMAENKLKEMRQILEDSQASLRKKAEALSTENSDILKSNKKLQEELMMEKRQYEVRIRESEAAITGFKNEINKLESEQAGKQNEFSMLKEQFANLSEQVSVYEKTETERQQQITTMQENMKHLQQSIALHENKKQELETTLLNMAKASDEDKESFKSSVAEKEKENRFLQDSVAKIELEIASLKEASFKLKSVIKEKETIISNFEHEKKDTKHNNVEATAADTSVSAETHISFLNSIIVDLQKKSEDLEKKLEVVLNGGRLPDANYNTVGGGQSLTNFQATRLYCDICEQFDLHDTEDCPTQESEPNSHHNMPRGGTRPYCDACEVFGHWTKDCDDGETF